MSERFTIFKGQDRPSLSEYITLNGEPVSFGPSDTATLQGRLSGVPGALKIDASAVIENPATGLVRYDWQLSDTDTAGLLLLWWELVVAGETQSSPAFVVPVIDQVAHDPGVGVYASVLDVKALAGFLSDAWTQISETDEADIGVFLAMTSGEIDAILLSLGATLPLDVGSAPAAALRSLTADGALVRALGATWPTNPPAGVLELRSDARARYTAGIAGLLNRTHPAALALAQATANSVGGSLWTEEPSYGRWGYREPMDWDPALAPSFRRGQRF